MKNIFLLLALLFCSSYSSLNATHLIGGDMRIEQIGINQFKITARYIALLKNVKPREIYCNLTDLNTNAFVQLDTLTLDTTRRVIYKYQSSDSLFIMEYSKIVSIANNPNGYLATINMSFARQTATNTSDMGSLIYTCQIPNPAIPGGNSNPKFIDYQDSMLFCVSNFTQIDFSCTDADGDVLVYSLFDPVSITSAVGGFPFTPINWRLPYSFTNILGPGSTCAINSSGILNARVHFLGIFTVAVKCEEFRNGVKIGETVREVPIPSINCQGNNTSLIEKSYSDNQDFELFPNPSNGHVTIKFNSISSNRKMQIYDLNGKIVFESDNVDYENKVDLTKLEKGLYLLKVIDEHSQTTKRIIVQ